MIYLSELERVRLEVERLRAWFEEIQANRACLGKLVLFAHPDVIRDLTASLNYQVDQFEAALFANNERLLRLGLAAGALSPELEAELAKREGLE